MNLIVIGVGALLLGTALGWLISLLKHRTNAQTAGQLIANARQESERLLSAARMQGHEQLQRDRAEFDGEIKQRRQEQTETEKRLTQREVNLDRKVDLFDRRNDEIARKELSVAERERELHKLQEELDELKKLSHRELQRVAGLTPDQARAELLAQVESEVRTESGTLVRRIMDEAKLYADREAKRLISIAVERCASTHVQSVTSCTLTLPSEDMKGRIIGREGRNIRAFESATGINVLIDDTPQAVVLSGFDPVRRELARITLERLVADGRINPARIEEEAAKVKEELEQNIQQAGEEAVFNLGLQKVHPELIRLLGRLKYRHSFAQNVLEHSIEVAHLTSMIAVEMGLNQQIAKRIGLFHDIGKAVDHAVEGPHAIIGGDLLRKYDEPAEVCQGVACHHREVEPVTLYGTLANAADAISASRPGARSESMELYLQRLEKLETIANSFAGVEKSYALQAGREIRVIVEPTKLTDGEAMQLARGISKRIESELQYPGQIKVTVIRETRSVEYAK
jgi:ribonuclease Y